MRRTLIPILLLALFGASFPTTAWARQGSAPRVRAKRLDAPSVRPIPRELIGRPDVQGMTGTRPAILLTGYWPPSNEMLRRFSPNPALNPQGWIGADWEGRGYDVHAHFPEFSPPDCGGCGTGFGELLVDYQHTTADFWPIADGLRPIAVITFSRGWIDLSWELEMNQYNRSVWIDDFLPPVQPTPAPPDGSVPAGHLRPGRLPAQEIVTAIADSGLGLSPYICWSGDGGGFLSEFIAYLGVWYQSLHEDPSDPAWCAAAGHVHVGALIDWDTARQATEVSLRALIAHLDLLLGCSGSVERYCSSSPNSVGPGAEIEALGQPSIGGNALELLAIGAPPGQFALFFYGTPQPGIPFGNGLRCVGSPTFRLNPPLLVDGVGYVSRVLHLDQPPLDAGPGAASVGALQGFQLWYRDPAGGGAGFNLSDALQITWCP